MINSESTKNWEYKRGLKFMSLFIDQVIGKFCTQDKNKKPTASFLTVKMVILNYKHKKELYVDPKLK